MELENWLAKLPEKNRSSNLYHQKIKMRLPWLVRDAVGKSKEFGV
jgi:hypothetical protein